MGNDKLFSFLSECWLSWWRRHENIPLGLSDPAKVVFVVCNALIFEELLPLMLRLRDLAGLSPVVILTKKFVRYADVVSSATNHGFSVVKAAKAIRAPRRNTEGRFRLLCRHIREWIEASQLQKKNPGTLIVGVAPSWGFETYLCRGYLKGKLPVVAVPCEDFLQSDADADAMAKPYNRKNASFLNKLTIKILPAFASASGQSLSVSAWGVWIALLTRASYTQDWWYQNPFIRFAIGNRYFMAQLESRFGLQKTFHLTGKPSQDLMASILMDAPRQKALLLSQHHLDGTKPTVVFALPQWAEEGTFTWEHHLMAVEFICRELSKVGANVFVTLHPRSNPERYYKILSRFGLVYTKLSASQLIPLCDTYVCGASTTARQALIAGKQVVVLGFPLDYPSFQELPVGYARTISDIEPLVTASLGKLAHRSLMLDGHATERIMELCISTTKK
jgi:hypothetical protein